jgi:hypothetical protein
MKRLAVLIIGMAIGNSALAASAGSGGLGTAFSRSSVSLGIFVGSGRAFDDDYTIVGVGAGYYLAEGLELGIDMQRWYSGEPTITKVSPQIRYVFTRAQPIKPYAGAFYRRTSFDEFDGMEIDDLNSFGYRLGAYFSSNNGVYIGGGVVYEEYEDCSRVTDCTDTSPELLFTISF